MQMTETVIDDMLMELIQHGTKFFPFQYYYEDINKFKAGYIRGHWHKEFEFVTVASGVVYCLIGTTKITLHEGQGIFINSGVVHGFEALETGIIPNILFSSEFIAPVNTSIYEKCVYPFLSSDFSHMVFSNEVAWQQDILATLSSIYLAFEAKKETMELDIHTQIGHIWSILFKHQEQMVTMTKVGTTLRSQVRLRNMIDFIEEGYVYKITLADIAQSANISKSEALRCFKCIDTSPMNYLNKYRLHKAKELLSSTPNTISDIATKVGFESTSYFNRMFKREYGVTPMASRKKSFR